MFRNEVENAEDFELVIVVNPVIVRPERSDARLWSFPEPADVLAGCLAAVAGGHGARRDPVVAEDAERSSEPPAGERHSPDER